MFRNPEEDIKKLGIVSINCLLADNGIGDMIGAFPAMDYILKQYPWVNLLVWLPDHMVDFAKNVLPSSHAIIRGYNQATKKYDNTRTGITTKWDKRTSPMKVHAVDYSFSVLCDENPSIEHKNYLKINSKSVNLSKFNLPDKYVVIQATAAEKVKEMPVATADAISKYVVGKGYTPIYLGKTNIDITNKLKSKAAPLKFDKSEGIDLVDKTSMLETIAIIDKAKCFIGNDGGLVHMAGCTDTAIVAFYSLIDWRHNAPIRHNQLGWNCYMIEPDIKCKFCQTNINFVYDFDYRSCFYKDFKCLEEETADKFIKHLESIL